MWVFTLDGFYSVAFHERCCEPHEVVVQSPARRDLERLLERLRVLGVETVHDLQIMQIDGTEYGYGAVVERALWRRYLARQVEEITYGTFTPTARHGHPRRTATYFDVWSRLYRWQDEERAT